MSHTNKRRSEFEIKSTNCQLPKNCPSLSNFRPTFYFVYMLLDTLSQLLEMKWHTGFTQGRKVSLDPSLSSAKDLNEKYISTFFYCLSHLFIFLLNFDCYYPTHNYLFEVNNESNRKRCEICSKLTIKTLELRHWLCSGVFTVNFVHISHIFLVFPSLTLSKSKQVSLPIRTNATPFPF